MKPIWESKTFWFNVLSGLLIILESQEFLNILPPGYIAYAALAVTVINVVLRVQTVEPVRLK